MAQGRDFQTALARLGVPARLSGHLHWQAGRRGSAVAASRHSSLLALSLPRDGARARRERLGAHGQDAHLFRGQPLAVPHMSTR